MVSILIYLTLPVVLDCFPLLPTLSCLKASMAPPSKFQILHIIIKSLFTISMGLFVHRLLLKCTSLPHCVVSPCLFMLCPLPGWSSLSFPNLHTPTYSSKPSSNAISTVTVPQVDLVDSSLLLSLYSQSTWYNTSTEGSGLQVFAYVYNSLILLCSGIKAHTSLNPKYLDYIHLKLY